MSGLKVEQEGVRSYEFLNASSADAVPTLMVNTPSTSSINSGFCDAIGCDTDGIIKIDYVGHDGKTYTEVLKLLGGVPVRFKNVTKLYRYYVSTTAGTAKSYTAAGAEVTNAIKLYRFH